MSPITRIPNPCWTVRCDICLNEVEGEDGGIIHFGSRGEALDVADSRDWLETPSGDIVCLECAEGATMYARHVHQKPCKSTLYGGR